MSPLRTHTPPHPCLDDLDSSIVLEGEVHEKALSEPFCPVPRKSERYNLRTEDFPSVPNGGVGVGVGAAYIQKNAKRIREALKVLKGVVIVVPKASTPGPDVVGAAASCSSEPHRGCLASPGGDGGVGTCEISEKALRAVPPLSMGDFVGAAVVDRNVREVVNEIMEKLALAGGDEDESLESTEEDGSEAVLITYFEGLDGNGAGYIDMRVVPSGSKGDQDYDVSHIGSRF